MDSRSKSLLDIRPEVNQAVLHINMSDEERFQNETLRPVIKMQNLLLVEAFKNYVNKHKGVFYELSLEKRLEYIERAIQKDIKFRNSLKGMVIGQFTIEEYQVYIQNSSALNKRMMNMVIERLKDQVQLLENGILIQDRLSV
ncbi:MULTISPECIES: glyoxalase [Flavobacteriaceae]|uniref:glyoxalase n=1 Tax=Flavobacteriaceae TaxID=49546 RepID=UPI001490D4D8|nr:MULTISPECIES: glyoxalase [Allomuricauda]MDC6364635.1 glyoxalase [Muricauda sp. AC10]